jgi:hypothetical protein
MQSTRLSETLESTLHEPTAHKTTEITTKETQNISLGITGFQGFVHRPEF